MGERESRTLTCFLCVCVFAIRGVSIGCVIARHGGRVCVCVCVCASVCVCVSVCVIVVCVKFVLLCLGFGVVVRGCEMHIGGLWPFSYSHHPRSPRNRIQ